jgi:hypothetical protein
MFQRGFLGTGQRLLLLLEVVRVQLVRVGGGNRVAIGINAEIDGVDRKGDVPLA